MLCRATWDNNCITQRAPKDAAATQPCACRVAAHRYEPSEWEQTWSEHVNEWSDPGTGMKLCEKMREQEEYVAAWDSGVKAAQASGCGALDSRLHEGVSKSVFSR